MDKILILANSDVGLYLFRKELIIELIKHQEVHIALPEGEYISALKSLGCKFHHVPVDRRGINPFSDLKLILKYAALIKKIKPNKIITYTIKPNIYGGIVAAWGNLPYAVNVTGLGTAFEKGKLLRKFVSFLYKLALRKAGVVFFENKANRNIFLKERIIRKAQACVLHGAGVNLDTFSVLPYPENTIGFSFLFMGRVMKEKGIDELLFAMKRLRDENYDCVLDIVGGLEEDYQDEIRQYEKEGWIHYHGFQSNVKPFIENCQCAILPSWHEGMSNTNLECAASGRPIITSAIPGCKEAVTDGISGYLSEAGNADSLYVCMKKMMQLSKRERELMGKAGRERMVKYFDRKAVIQKTLQKLL